jgi:dTDP-glucose pyrophosphorylase
MTENLVNLKKAVILARGLGNRMRSIHPEAKLSDEQRAAADAGMKAMIPMGRPFLDFVLSELADAGIGEVCIIVGPEHTAIRDYYMSLSTHRIKIVFAIQERPLGTANAVLSAQSCVASEPFLVLNSDNYYPVQVFRALRNLEVPGLAAFDREWLVQGSNIPVERIRDYALLQIDADGWLERIVEKPAAVSEGNQVFVSMNCWRFDPRIFRACEQVPRSVRGEFELPQAVQFGISSLGLRFKAVPFRTAVLDLSYRSDVAAIAERLSAIRPLL